MSNSIYVTTTDPRCGKSVMSLGIVDLLLRRTSRVGVFRPVITARSTEEKDKNIDLLLSYFGLDLSYEDTFAFLRSEARGLIAQGKYDDLMNGIIEKYKALEEQSDFILCIGSDLEGEGVALEFDFDADVARNLGCPVLILSSAANRDIPTVVSAVRATLDACAETGAGDGGEPCRHGDGIGTADRAQGRTAR